ncbi:DUF1810 domain-containing protein [Pedobacter sp. Leaf194]|uniref:DUF1810 domain-containing protein n=1 Tax=Pedobacter sp. Leaf194 TaxID=1736297 RepID=UPI00070367F6|nr:DUF1810 domain-containing protein [Pedobacter sp. Leaf194]KQS32259.1 calpastatin [Pedobacter sp. Leaf194]
MKTLSRFIDAQQSAYDVALSEIKSGRKTSHWMWYIFPQVKGLGFSETSKFYGIESLDEASAYLEHPVLGKRLIEICEALLKLKSVQADEVFGRPDDMKLKSSMTLFAAVPNSNVVFSAVLEKFFKGEQDKNTLRILGI